MARLSIAIPSRNETYLNHTIRDVLAKAKGDIKIFPILDGYEPEELVEDDRVSYIRIPLGDGATHMRQGINEMVERATGEYVMKLDAHCLVGEGFDEILIRDHQPDWIQIPRRKRLDAVNWKIIEDERPPVDYEYIVFHILLPNSKIDSPGIIYGSAWDDRTKARWDIPIDDTMHFQGSCYFMTKDWYKRRNFLQVEGYGGWAQECEELAFNTLLNGGEVKTNKNTFYAHLHKVGKDREMYTLPKEEVKAGYTYSHDLWVRKHQDFFFSYIESFMPMPLWPDNWKDILCRV